MFYELRRYQARPGRRAELVALMEDTIIPYQASLGMDITASFVDEQDADIYIWMRRFESETEREELYAKVYQSEKWKNEIAPAIDAIFIRASIVVTRLVPTEKSPLR